MVICMMIPTFVACTTEDDSDISETDDNSKTTGSQETETQFQSDSLNEDLKFNTSVRVLGDQTYRYQVYCFEDEIEGDPIKEVVYKRSMTVEDRLGIEIIMDTASAGAWGGATKFAQEVETAIDTDPYDALACYNLTPYMLAQKGFCANLYNDDSYLDLTAPWWPSALLDEILVNDTLYAVSESNDWGLLHNMMAMFFNVEMLEARNMESPYDLVANNEWTIDKLSEMIKDTYEDKNGDSKRDKDDIYGFVNATTAKRDACSSPWVINIPTFKTTRSYRFWTEITSRPTSKKWWSSTPMTPCFRMNRNTVARVRTSCLSIKRLTSIAPAYLWQPISSTES